MSSDSILKRAGLTPAKAVLIVVLAITLIAVVWMQTSDEGVELAREKNEKPPAERRDSKPDETRVLQNETPDTSKTEPPKQWPVMSSRQAGQYDPFARPAWSIVKSAPRRPSNEVVAQATAERKQKLDELKRAGVKAIVLTEKGHVAMIGQKEVRVGDVVNGFQVSEINATGIVLIDQDVQ